MSVSQVWQQSGTGRAHPVRAAVRSSAGRHYRVGVRLWTLLHAPALLNGRTGGQNDVDVIEDDRRRLTPGRR
jgi:hypothetical protein